MSESSSVGHQLGLFIITILIWAVGIVSIMGTVYQNFPTPLGYTVAVILCLSFSYYWWTGMLNAVEKGYIK